MPVYIEKINGDVDQPTDQPTDQQGEYRAICLFEGRDLQLQFGRFLCWRVGEKL